MLNVPSELAEPCIVWKEPFACGMNAAGPGGTFVKSIGTITGPLDVQYVSIQVPLTVPAGVTFQDCVTLPPALVAVNEN